MTLLDFLLMKFKFEIEELSISILFIKIRNVNGTVHQKMKIQVSFTPVQLQLVDIKPTGELWHIVFPQAMPICLTTGSLLLFS